MKLSWKIFFISYLIIILTIGIGGFALINYSFRLMLKNQIDSASESNLYAVNTFIAINDKSIDLDIEDSVKEISEMKKPALVACLNDIHEWYENKGQCELNLLDSFTKTVVGRMIKSILAPFGYRVTKQKDIPKAASKKYFSSASCYELLAPEEATLHIVKRIDVK